MKKNRYSESQIFKILNEGDIEFICVNLWLKLTL